MQSGQEVNEIIFFLRRCKFERFKGRAGAVKWKQTKESSTVLVWKEIFTRRPAEFERKVEPLPASKARRRAPAKSARYSAASFTLIAHNRPLLKHRSIWSRVPRCCGTKRLVVEFQ